MQVDPQTQRKYYYNTRTQQSLWFMPIMEREIGTCVHVCVYRLLERALPPLFGHLAYDCRPCAMYITSRVLGCYGVVYISQAHCRVCAVCLCGSAATTLDYSSFFEMCFDNNLLLST